MLLSIITSIAVISNPEPFNANISVFYYQIREYRLKLICYLFIQQSKQEGFNNFLTIVLTYFDDCHKAGNDIAYDHFNRLMNLSYKIK